MTIFESNTWFFIFENFSIRLNPYILFVTTVINTPRKSKIFIFMLSLKNIIDGRTNKVIASKFKEYVPIRDKIWIEYVNSDKLKAVKFHGKPVRIVPLKYSKNDMTVAKYNIDEKL